MGMTLANLHILGGDPDQIRSLMPQAAVGVWSSGCVSVFAPDLQPPTADRQARALSRKIPQCVLSVWLFDEDAAGFSIFRSGKREAAHILDPDGYSNLGNIPLFCRLWGLPEEDVPRLRAVWKKGGAEEQLYLTGCLLGLPLCHDSQMLPRQSCRRDTAPVDQWIRERPAPPRIRNQARAELIQEIPGFRYHATGTFTAPFYVSVDPYDDPYAYDGCHLWKAQEDGTVREIWGADEDEMVYASSKRAVCVEPHTRRVLYDSAGQLSGICALSGDVQLMERGEILQERTLEKSAFALECLGPDGTLLWSRKMDPACDRVLSWNDRELLLQQRTREQMHLIRLDLADGRETGRADDLVGTDVHKALWDHGAWWITHNGFLMKDGTRSRERRDVLTKLDEKMRTAARLPLPSWAQELCFSPDRKRLYVFFFESQVWVLEGESLVLERTLEDKSFLAPLGFDTRGTEHRLWLLRGNSTVEAWDEALTAPVSRHRLKGRVTGQHKDGQGRLCVTTWDERKNVFRVFRLT